MVSSRIQMGEVGSRIVYAPAEWVTARHITAPGQYPIPAPPSAPPHAPPHPPRAISRPLGLHPVPRHAHNTACLAAMQAGEHSCTRARALHRLTAQAAVRVRGAIRLAAQKLAGLELVLGLAVGAEGEELVVELAGASVPHADGAERLEHVGKVGGALRHAPVEDGRRDWKETCMAHPDLEECEQPAATIAHRSYVSRNKKGGR